MIDWSAWGRQIWAHVAAAGISTGLLLAILGCFVLLAALLQIVTTLLRTRWFELLGERSWTLLAMPGTIVHETGHALFCLLFRHKIEEMKLFAPMPDGTLGYVRHTWEKRSLYQRAGNFFIGTGPVIFGTAVIIVVTAWLLPEVRRELELPSCHTLGDLAAGALSLTCRMIRELFRPELWTKYRSYIWIVLTLLIGSHITLSKSDLENAGSGALLLPLLLFLLDLAVIRWFDPAEFLLRRGGSFLAGALAAVFFVLLILAGFTLLIYLPVFRKGSPKPSRRK